MSCGSWFMSDKVLEYGLKLRCKLVKDTDCVLHKPLYYRLSAADCKPQKWDYEVWEDPCYKPFGVEYEFYGLLCGRLNPVEY